jgi:hypothetical protein
MHWIWVSGASSDAELVLLETPPIVEQLDLHFDTGALQAGPVPSIVLQRDDTNPGMLTDNLVAPGVNGLVFSSRLRQVLAAAGIDNIQYFDFTIRTGDGVEIRDYWIANIVGRVACVDMARSELALDADVPGEVAFIESLALNEEAAAGFDLFRLHEDNTVVVASDRVKRVCEETQITGVTFCHPANFCF